MSASSSHPENYDDFKLIHGIGPGIERRLYNANIHTYGQLAALTADDLARILHGLAGLSAKSIAQQDWIDQALKLASEHAEEWTEYLEERVEQGEARAELSTALESVDESPASEGMAPESRKHYENFKVELTLDEDNTVSRTRVQHVQELIESAWNGWEGQKLINFIEEHAGLLGGEPREIRLQPAVFTASEPASTGLIIERLAPPRVFPRDQFVVKKMEVITADNPSPGHILSSDQPFRFHLALDLSQIKASPGTLLGYSAKVFAKDLSRGTHLVVGAYQGELSLDGQAEIDIEGDRLPAGIYRLDTVVTLSPPSGVAPRAQQLAFLEGGVFHVY